MAVALIQFWLAMPLALYGTLLIMLLAYVGRYVPLGVRAANARSARSTPRWRRARGSSARRWLTTLREVTLPLIRPGLFAGWLLVFVPAIQELSASILLFSSSSITLAVAVYNLYETGYLEPVAALAIVTMVIIGAAIWLANRLVAAAWHRAATPRRCRQLSGIVMAGITISGLTKTLRRRRSRRGGGRRSDLEIEDNAVRHAAGPERLRQDHAPAADRRLHRARRRHDPRRRPARSPRPAAVVPPEQRGMGMVFQNYAVWPHKTVYENVVFGLKVRQVPAAEARAAGRGRRSRW